jgi:hypothetical protein
MTVVGGAIDRDADAFRLSLGVSVHVPLIV